MQWFSNLVGVGSQPDDVQIGHGGAPSTLTNGSTSPPPPGGFPLGSIVEYYSASLNKWIVARVLSYNADFNTYNLDCKEQVPVDRIRVPPGSMPPGTTGSVGTPSFGDRKTQVASSQNMLPPPPQFPIGSIIEYWSESQNNWILARVLSFDPSDGTYNLDCKPNVNVQKLRWASPGSLAALQSQMDLNQTNGGAPLSTTGALPLMTSQPSIDQNSVRPPATTSQVPPNSTTGSVPGSKAQDLFVPAHMKVPTPQKAMPSTPALSVPGASLSGQEAPLQLLRVAKGPGGKWLFEVNDEAAKTLEAEGQRHLAVASVCGLYRTGKSYLLNLLLERIQQGQRQFRVGGTTNACTDGIWMWGSHDTGDLLTLFLDCEGFGSTTSDRTRDAKLMTLCVLISSVFILNTKGVLNESLFNSLSLVCHLAKHLDEQGGGQEVNKPVLLWLLRDFVLQLETQDGKDMSPDEYLEQQLHAMPLPGEKADRSNAAREVRQSLLHFFPERSCVTLVTPIIDEAKLQKLEEVPYEQLRPEFRVQFEELRGHVIKLARNRPKAVGGTFLSCVSFVALLRRLVDALNSDMAISIKTAWQSVQHSACCSLIEELKADSSAALRTAASKGALPNGQPLPVRDAQLAAALKERRRQLKKQWNDRAVGDDAVRMEYWHELKESLQMDEQELERKNNRLAEEQLEEALSAWNNWLSSEQNDSDTNGGKVSEAPDTLIRLLGTSPAIPAARTAGEALESIQRARQRWHNQLESSTRECSLLKAEVAAQKEESAGKGELHEQVLEREREAGKLQGQVESLADQAKAAIARESKLKEQILNAEEASRKEQKELAAAKTEINDFLAKVNEKDHKVKELERKVAELEAEKEEAMLKLNVKPKPGCKCVVQ